MDLNGGNDDGDRRKPADELEKELADRLTDGPLEAGDKERIVRARLSPKYEIRIQTASDPIVEETKLYRSIAKELDGRYDKYASAGRRGGAAGPAHGAAAEADPRADAGLNKAEEE
ncbi:MAG TPA: hypothetical protein VMS09_09640 [Paenibacillus sp.]|uniref:hypothetical protein n=1 Tax=Paenibacillus sp. TaxID=58172 RepID=UPI0028D78C30|nr:hypothetical protein [Paenibacillus sp.]HUC92278.1 hypothetical protein [Paenibacillus sp.]